MFMTDPNPAEPAASVPSAVSSPFLPILLLACAIVASLAFQSAQLVRERHQLELAGAGLDAQEQAALKLRASLDAVATSTAQLAAAGNVNARAVVEQLRARGITINPAGAVKPP